MADIKLSSLASSGGTQKSEAFTSSGTWTRPNSNITAISYILVGAGGGAVGVALTGTFKVGVFGLLSAAASA